MRPLHAFALLIALLFLIAIARLARLEAGGPAHEFVNLPGQEPATLYMPGDANAFFRVFPPATRPPAVVLVHGFISDRRLMSGLARRMAQNGYAVLAIDVSGHGENRNPFASGEVNQESLRPDVRKAVEFLRNYKFVDGSRIAVMGHSMGAGAVLDYATTDPALKGAVMISGGFGLEGAERPRNALFIFAEHDPDPIKAASAELATHLAGVPQVEMGKAYGDFQQGNAVEALQVAGANHISIMSSPDAAHSIIKWLDGAFGTARTGEMNLRDPRRVAVLIALIIFLILLVPLGKISGEIAGSWSDGPAGLGGWWGLLILSGALLAAMPLVALIVPAAFFPLVIGDVQISWFMAAGLMMGIVLLLAGVFASARLWDAWGLTMLAAVVAMTVIYLCQVAISVTFHTLALTPERFIFAIAGALLMLPFWLSFELMLRRGAVAIATIRSAIGRIVIIGLMVAGVLLQVLPFVLMLVLPSLVLIYVMVEVFAASAYSSSRNLALIALVESAWFAWIIAATNPITFML